MGLSSKTYGLRAAGLVAPAIAIPIIRIRVGNSRSHSTGRVGSNRMVDSSRSHNKGSYNRNTHGDKHGDTVVASSRPFQRRHNFSLQATDFLHLALSPPSFPANGAANYKYRCGHQAGE